MSSTCARRLWTETADTAGSVRRRTGPGEHRPHDEQYWQQPWAMQLFAGDLFEAVPFGDQPTHIVSADGEDGATKHYVGEMAFGYGLLTTPTCDMTDQREGGVISHPFRVLVPVVPLDQVLAGASDVDRNLGLLRGRDALTAYLYLPALAGVLEEEHVACLFRPSLVPDELLREPPRRVAQLQPEARRHLKVKLAAYWGRARVRAEDLPLHERGEEDLRAEAWPPSPYDPPELTTSV